MLLQISVKLDWVIDIMWCLGGARHECFDDLDATQTSGQPRLSGLL